MTSQPPKQAIRTIELTRYEDDPLPKAAPLIHMGRLGWIRKNLLRTEFDTALTIISGIIIVAAVTAAIRWAIGAANWFVVTFNMRLFMVGRLEPSAEWRVQVAVLMLAAVLGFALAAYTRVKRRAAGIIVVILALLFIVPLVTQALVPIPPTYLAAGNTAVQSGTVNETPLTQVGFIGARFDVIRLEIASDYSGSDEALASLTSFEDKVSNALRNNAIDHLEALERQAELERLLSGDALTANQRTQLETEQANFAVPPVAVEAYNVNQVPINVRILRGSTLQQIFEGELIPGTTGVSVTLPENGWYVLEKTAPEGSEGVSIIAAHGIGPILERTVNQEEGNTTAGSISQYVRMTDRFFTTERQPTVDGTPNGQRIPFVVIIDHQYRGEASFAHFMRLYVTPFFNQINIALLAIVAAGAIGYGLCRVVDRIFGKPHQPRRPSFRISAGLIFLVMPVVFVLIYGLDELTITMIALLITLFVTYRLASNISQWVSQLWHPEALGAQFIRTVITIGLICLVAVLVYGLVTYVFGFVTDTAEDALPVTNTSRWGGLMLTLFLAISGIVLSFPLGILLALGRRSSLPVVSGFCTLYIEFVRGVPLITVLFMSQLLVPLASPALAEVDNVFRAMIGIVLFSAAYLAENVRGGLQALPKGQTEAAKAVGLNGAQITLLVTLPQALRIAQPALVGQFISLLKDTSLVAVVGLIDLTGVADTVYAQTEFIGLRRETLLFITVIYFFMCYSIAQISRSLERSGSGVMRRQQL